LSCLDKWSKRLPPIIGEIQENKISVIVELGHASKFLTYDPYTRVFNTTFSSKKIAPGEYEV